MTEQKKWYDRHPYLVGFLLLSNPIGWCVCIGLFTQMMCESVDEIPKLKR